MPQAAFVEDCDSDGNVIKPNSREHARRKATVKPVKIVQRPASDSGYSSYGGALKQPTIASQAQNVVTVTTARGSPSMPSSSKPKPVVHRSDSRNSKQNALARSSSASGMGAVCPDLNCGHAACLSVRNKERRYTLPQQNYAPWPPYYQPHVPQAQQPQQPQVQYPQALPAPPAPIMDIPQRTTRTRPLSTHGYGSVMYAGGQQGPPLSPSSYHNIGATYHQPYQQPPPYYGTTPPNPLMTYSTQSPVAPSPTSPNYGAAPTFARTYMPLPADPVATHGPVKAPAQSGVNQPMSARQHVPGALSGRYQEPESPESESESESESDTSSTDSEEEERARKHERERQRDHRRRAQKDKERMPPPLRPSLNQRKTTTSVPPRPAERTYRRTRSVTNYDPVESDRVTRPHESRTRTDSSYSGRSRRQSVSTTTSSGRTPATTISDGSQRVIVEDRYGRRVAYLPKEVQDDLVRRYEQQKLEEKDLNDRIEAYQNTVRGGEPEKLTAASLEKMKQTERRTSGSQVSGHSRKSSRSSKISKTDGIRIETGGTVLYVHGSANVEMHPGEDGGPARLIINNSNGMDSAYGGSKSSSSRQGRSRGGSDLARVREEDYGGYERPL